MTRARAIPALALAAAALPGCVQRTMTITSDPPGATVWVNDVEVGRTPVEAGFTYYGVYDLRLELDGYQPISTSRDATQPWWENPPFDIGAEMWPGALRSDIRWHFRLAPSSRAGELSPARERLLLERARSFESRTSPAPR